MSLAGTTTMTKRKRPEPEATQEQDMKYAEEELTPVPKSKHKKDGKEESPDVVIIKTEDAQTPPQSMRPWPGAKIPDKSRTIYMSIESPARGMHPSEIDSAWRLDFRDGGGCAPKP